MCMHMKPCYKHGLKDPTLGPMFIGGSIYIEYKRTQLFWPFESRNVSPLWTAKASYSFTQEKV